MSLINIPAFSGLNILAAPQRIREDEATVAIGCDFRSLDLRSFRGDKDTGMGVTNPSAILTDGASIFQWDATHWIGTLGDKNFARSPTFFADGTTGQRIFVCDNAAPYPANSPEIAWNWVQEVELVDLSTQGMRPTTADGVGSYFLGHGTRRLGVPKPAAINTDKVEHIDRRGPLASMVRSTKADTYITLAAGTNAELKVADKIILTAPAIGPGAFAVSKKSSDTPPKFTLRNTRLKYKGVELVAKQGETTVVFKKVGHGLVGGEQMLLNKPAGAASDDFISTKVDPTYKTTLWTVEYIDPDKFRLLTPVGFEFTLKDKPGANGNWPFRYAVVADAEDAIDFDGLYITAVTLADGDAQHQVLSITGINADAGIEWESALDTLSERSYCVTFVNKFGDESEPSEPTKAILVAQGDPVTFTQTTSANGSNPATTTVALPVTMAAYAGELKETAFDQYRTPDEIRLYRTDATGTFRLVTTGVDDKRIIKWAEANTVDFAFVDTYEDSELGEPLSTAGWQIPPKDLNGILISPGGSLVGYKERSVIGSVPYAPYAFPVANRVAFDHIVMGLVATSAGLVAVTDGSPSLIVGDDPGAWTIQKLEYPYGCVSRRSIVDMGEMAIYASADGLVGVVGANVEILTKDTIKREDWQAIYNPANIRAAHAEGRYYATTQLADGTRKAFMFDPRTRSFIDLSVGTPYPVALYSRRTDDTLLLLKSDGKVYAWNRGTDWVPYTWQSKWFQLTRPDILGCGQVLSPALIANYSMTMTLYGWDGENVVEICRYTTGAPDPANRIYKFDKNVNPFRLPVPPDRYTIYTVKIEGTLPVGQVSLASTIDELKTV